MSDLYLVFGGADYEPRGGMADLIGTVTRLVDVWMLIESEPGYCDLDWIHVFEVATGNIIPICRPCQYDDSVEQISMFAREDNEDAAEQALYVKVKVPLEKFMIDLTTPKSSAPSRKGGRL